MDRRRSSRYQLRLPVLTEWKDEADQVRYSGGFSRDIALHGLFVISSELPPSNTFISVSVALPNVRAGSQELKLRTTGSVARIEQGGLVDGYAIDCDFTGIEHFIK